MSALPPKADIETQSRDVCFVQKADIRVDSDIREKKPEDMAQVVVWEARIKRSYALQSTNRVCPRLGRFLRVEGSSVGLAFRQLANDVKTTYCRARSVVGKPPCAQTRC